MFGSEEDCRSEQLSNGEYVAEALHQYADVYGLEDVDREWILSPFDSWMKNPHYTGTPGRHPEEDWDEEDEEEVFAYILNQPIDELDLDTNDCPF